MTKVVYVVVRIISGSKRGLKLADFEGMDIRPTSDRVKEALFSMIRQYVEGSNVLDLFAGTGSLALEALSRGAKSAVLVDNNKFSGKVINQNINKTRFNERVKFINTDAISFLKATQDKFDIIFVDPPYNQNIFAKLIDEIISHDIINNNGIIVYERDELYNHSIGDELRVLKDKKYGRTYITVFEKV